MFSHVKQPIKRHRNVSRNFYEIFLTNFFLVPFQLIRCARGGGVSEDIENISLDILAQKRLEQGWKNFNFCIFYCLI
jgi:hypothetical protein